MSKWESAGKSDEWYTPKYVFDAMGFVFGLDVVFDLDVAAPKDRTFCYVPAKNFITEGSIESDWNGFVWMNPPFGGRNSIGVWLDKIFMHNDGIALTPDRTSAAWWQRAASQCDAILFVKGKIKFIRPDGTEGKSPSTGTTLFGYGCRAKHALALANDRGLGILLKMA
jgi:DNA N-6-adenine-methyltransferase Dam